MIGVPGGTGAPDVREVDAICALTDPVLRNLRITWCYHQLSASMAARTGPCSNWCTFATWASKQAGATIRGEDLFDALRRRLARPAEARHPIRSLWRALLRRGLFRPETSIGRIVRAIHTPFDAFERTSAAVARGNLKVFEEIGRAFARYLRDCPAGEPPSGPAFTRFLDTLSTGDPPDGQSYLRRAFTRYQQVLLEADPAVRTELVVLANLEIGLHEQTRLQPEIRAALDAPVVTVHDLRARVLDVLLPGLGWWRRHARRALAAPAGAAAAALARYAAELAREAVTERLMVLALPGNLVLSLGRHLDAPVPEPLRRPRRGDFVALLERFEACRPPQDDCGARDWSSLDQRMHYIVHLFCAFHERTDLLSPPFTEPQVRAILAGRLPDGVL